jgi:hypothetical protein
LETQPETGQGIGRNTLKNLVRNKKYNTHMHQNRVSNRNQNQNQHFSHKEIGKYVFNCQWVGNLHARRILSERCGLYGDVISVFDTTLNVKTNNDDLLVVTISKVRSPINMNVLPIFKEKERGGGIQGFRGIIDFGTEVKIQKNEMSIGNVIFRLGKCRVFQSALDRLPSANHLSEFMSKSDEIFKILKTYSRKGCLLSPDLTTKGLLSKFLKNVHSYRCGYSNAFTATAYAMMSQALLDLCGKGPGYTPSGDDFVAGYLGVFNWISRSLNFNTMNFPSEKFAPLTSWMSSKLIDYSKRNLCDEEIQAMINSIAAGDLNQYISSIVKISRRGHTSGIDIATGMTVALYTVIDDTFETNLIERFFS